jgi:hypothetical protein
MPWHLKLAVTLVHPYILAPHLSFSPFFLPCAWTKKKRGSEERERAKEKKGNRKKYQGLDGAAPHFSLSPGGAGLDSFHHYTGPSAKTHEACVYVGGKC